MAETPIPPPDAAGLPPVVPPTGRMVAQLFIVPALIVAGVIAIIFGFTWLTGGPRTAEGLLEGLQDTNPEVRKRAANDLAQVLLRDEVLACNVPFAIGLTEQLQSAINQLEPPRKLREESAQDRQLRLTRRKEVQYLAACVGNLSIPVGAPVLAELATKPIGGDEKSEALLHRQAVWALANLGNHRARFDKLTPEMQKTVRGELDRFSSGAGDAANWARAASESLSDKSSGGVIAALAKCAAADDPFLRKEAALALSFWTGDAAENKLAEDTLLRLTHDDGHGNAIKITEDD